MSVVSIYIKAIKRITIKTD